MQREQLSYLLYKLKAMAPIIILLIIVILILLLPNLFNSSDEKGKTDPISQDTVYDNENEAEYPEHQDKPVLIGFGPLLDAGMTAENYSILVSAMYAYQADVNSSVKQVSLVPDSIEATDVKAQIFSFQIGFNLKANKKNYLMVNFNKSEDKIKFTRNDKDVFNYIIKEEE